MGRYRKFAKDVGWVGISQLILGLQGLLLLPILTKFLGVTEFGIWSQVKITITLVGGFAALALPGAIVRFISGQEDKQKISKEFLSVLLVGAISALIFGLLVFLGSDMMGNYLTHIKWSGFFFKFGSFLILLNVVHGLFISFFMSKRKMFLVSVFESLRALLEIGLIYLFLHRGYGLTGVIGAFILIKLVIIVVQVLKSKKYLALIKPSFSIAKPYLVFGFPLAMARTISWVIQVGDQYVIGYLIDAKAVGIYALAYSLCYLVQTITVPIIMVLSPAVSHAWNQGDIKSFKIYFGYSYKYLLMIIIPSVVGLSILAEPIIRIFSTPEFLGGVIVIPFVAAGIGIRIFFGLGSQILQLQKKTKKLRNYTIFFAGLNVVLNFVFVPLYGYLGAAISTLLTFLFSAVIGINIIRKFIDLKIWFLIKSFMSAITMGVSIHFIRSLPFGTDLFKVSFSLILGTFVYFVLLYMLNGFTYKEIKFFRSLLGRRKKKTKILY